MKKRFKDAARWDAKIRILKYFEYMQYQLCVFGNPVEHSLSPQLHLAFAKACGLEVSFVKIKPELSGFRKAIINFKNNGGFGASVTAPFKQEAFALSTQLTEAAQIAQSVNTLTFQGDNIIGDNTDGIGLINDIKNNLKYALAGKKIMILGAGGATHGILPALLKENPAVIYICNRTHSKSIALSAINHDLIIPVAETTVLSSCVDVLIDATSVNAMIAPPKAITVSSNSLFYDLKYTPSNNTALEKWLFKRTFSRIADGYGMLREQAKAAFERWTGHVTP